MKRFSIMILALALCLTGCGQQTKEASAQIFAMDTVMDLTAYGRDAEAAVSEAEGQIGALEAKLSRTLSDSDVTRINENGTAPTTAISAGARELLAAAMEYSRATDGAFDITVAPVMDAWGFTGDCYRVPDAAELDALLPLVDSGRLTVAETPEFSVALGAGQSIDLGGIAKGYTSDLVEVILRANDIESGKISLGGNVFVLGAKPDGTDWRVGIRDPRNDSGLAVILPLRDAYAITSGGYERYFEENGKTYHHIIDPADGCPADSGLLSVTVVADANGPDGAGAGHGTMCDAFSTALFVMGEERALDFWRSSGYAFELVLITADGRVVITDGLAHSFEKVEDSGYTYETVS